MSHTVKISPLGDGRHQVEIDGKVIEEIAWISIVADGVRLGLAPVLAEVEAEIEAEEVETSRENSYVEEAV